MNTFVSIAECSRFNAAKLAKNNLFTTERMFCDVYCLLPGQAQAPHAHAGSDKIYVILEGEARLEVAGVARTLGPHEAALCASGVVHGISNVSSAPAKVLVFMTPKP
ncbi:MAG TPA: cupin domain-containing protein [Myxococcota bacterium]|nr:cupin domain-containing protein [Myxococcota bacterium]